MASAVRGRLYRVMLLLGGFLLMRTRANLGAGEGPDIGRSSPCSAARSPFCGARRTQAATDETRAHRLIAWRRAAVRSLAWTVPCARLPLADPGVPDTRSPARYLWWVARGQMADGPRRGHVRHHLDGRPVGHAGDHREGHRRRRHRGRHGCALVLGAWCCSASVSCRPPPASSGTGSPSRNWLIAAYRTVQVLARHTVRLGATLPRQVSTGEVISIGSSDLAHVGNSIEVMGRGAGAVVSFFVVALILLNTSTTLGLVVLIGMPALLLALVPILRPLQTRNMAQREMMGQLNSLGADIVGGLRVLRGIGGEEVFHRRYARRVPEGARRRRAGGPAAVPARLASGAPPRAVRGRRGLDRRAVRGRG